MEDGVGDNSDAFPNDPTEIRIWTNDGVGDNADAFDNDPTETTDSDGMVSVIIAMRSLTIRQKLRI